VAYELIKQADHGRQVLIFRRKEDIYQYVADRFLEISKKAIAQTGRFSIALSGGKTPEGLYHELRLTARSADWRAIHIFLVDERFVPVDDDRSNYRMIRRSLIEAVPIPSANVNPVATTGDPVAAARDYETELIRFFDLGPGDLPAFDLILLGMGEDGHTASLFPGLPDIQNDRRLVRAIEANGERTARITLTLPVINQGRQVFFLVTGTAKAGTVLRVVEEEDLSLPAALVHPGSGPVVMLLDRDAGALLRTNGAEERSA
jgi:6-phosphogluconolactonase